MMFADGDVGGRFLVSDYRFTQNRSPIEVVVVEVAEKAVKLRYASGAHVWVMRSELDGRWAVIERLRHEVTRNPKEPTP